MVSFEDTYAIVFPDAQSALDNDFASFKSLLSRDAVIDGSLENALLGSDSNQTENRRINQIYDRSFSRINRLTMFASIEAEIVTAFSEELVSDNPELLEKSYVETADRIRFDDRVKMSIVRRDHVLRSRPLRPIGKGGLKAVTNRIVETKVQPRPIALLTLGLVGAGKTTFLNYVEKVSARDSFSAKGNSQRSHWMYIDFRNFSPAQTPRDHIYSGIFDYITGNEHLSDYKRSVAPSYEKEINSLRRGPLALIADDDQAIRERISELLIAEYKEKIPYCSKILSYTAGKSPIFLVIDNVDQIESQEVQANIFLEALSIARRSKLNLVLAMRDATYVKNKASAVFDAFDFDAIYIDAPDIPSVLSKRFTIAEQLLQNKSFDFIGEGGKTVHIDRAASVVSLLSTSVLSTEVGRLIEVTATGDVRLALQMTRQFLQYGYSSSYRAYRAFTEFGRYRFPPHEALRVIMLGNQSIYRDEFSPIINPFDAKTARSESQFLRLYIMSALVAAASTRAFQGLEVNEVTGALEKLGFSQRVTTKVIHDLIRGRVCFTKSHQEFSGESVIVPSRLCGYMIRELLGRFVFIETAMVDTFIYDDVVWAAIKGDMKRVYHSHKTVERFSLRKKAGINFYNWVEREVSKLCDQAGKRNLGPLWTTNPMTRMKVDFSADLSRAQGSVFRNYGNDADLAGLPLFYHEEDDG